LSLARRFVIGARRMLPGPSTRTSRELELQGSRNPSGWRTGGKWVLSWSRAEWDGAVKYGLIPPSERLIEELKVGFTEFALGGRYKQPSDENEDEQAGKDSTTAADARPKLIAGLYRIFKEPRMDILRRQIDALDRQIASLKLAPPVVYSNLLSQPLTEP
jgi:hypothetical protein